MSRPVIEQLVDALERITSGIVKNDDGHIRVPEAAFDIAAAAIVAACAALVEPEPEPVAWWKQFPGDAPPEVVPGSMFLPDDALAMGWRPLIFADATPPQHRPEDARVIECAARLVEYADFRLGGCLSASSKARDIPSNATSQVKARHLASLRDALTAVAEHNGGAS